MTQYNFRIYYSKDTGIKRSLLLVKADALARFEVFEDAFMVTKEVGWFKRILRLRQTVTK